VISDDVKLLYFLLRFVCTIAPRHYVLQPYLLGQTNIPYHLRTVSQNMTMINKSKFLNDTDFIIRMLYKYSY